MWVEHHLGDTHARPRLAGQLMRSVVNVILLNDEIGCTDQYLWMCRYIHGKRCLLLVRMNRIHHGMYTCFGRASIGMARDAAGVLGQRSQECADETSEVRRQAMHVSQLISKRCTLELQVHIANLKDWWHGFSRLNHSSPRSLLAYSGQIFTHLTHASRPCVVIFGNAWSDKFTRWHQCLGVSIWL